MSFALLEGLLDPSDKLAVLYPGCSADSNVVLNVADSSLLNVTIKIHDYYTGTCSWVAS